MGRRGIVEEAARLDRRIANRLVGLDVSDAREPDEVPNPTAAASVALKRCRVELDRQAHLRLTPKSATRFVTLPYDEREVAGLGNCQAAATSVRHVLIAAARSTRCVWADVRWGWTLKVLP